MSADISRYDTLGSPEAKSCEAFSRLSTRRTLIKDSLGAIPAILARTSICVAPTEETFITCAHEPSGCTVIGRPAASTSAPFMVQPPSTKLGPSVVTCGCGAAPEPVGAIATGASMCSGTMPTDTLTTPCSVDPEPGVI